MMAEQSLSTPAPAQVVTTVQPANHPLADRSFTFSDIQLLLGFLVAVAVIGGFVLAIMGRVSAKRKDDQERAAIKRAEDQKDAKERTTLIMDSISKSHSDSARDVRELTEKVKDGRTVLEKDIEQIRSIVRHDISSVKTLVQGVQHFGEKNAEEISKLRDRMTAQETDSKHQNDALNKLESTVREKIDEMKVLIKSQGETTTAQFKELATSIREAREVRPKS